MNKLTADINLDEEVTHLADFIRQKWSPIDNLEALIADIRDEAFQAARGWFIEFDLWEMVTDLADSRAELLRNSVTLDVQLSLNLYDAYCCLLNDFSRNLPEVRKAAYQLDGDWDFSTRVSRLVRTLQRKFPDLNGARPLGWDALANGYSDFDGQEEYDPTPDAELFKGVRITGAHTPSFPSQVALPYVMYDEKCQGRKASHVLVGAVFTQFLGIQEFLNTLKVKEALQAEVFLAELARPEMLYHSNFVSENPILKVLLQLAKPSPTEAAFQDALGHYRAYAALSDAEKAAREAAKAERIREIIQRLRDQRGLDGQYEEAKKRNLKLLRDVFSVSRA